MSKENRESRIARISGNFGKNVNKIERECSQRVEIGKNRHAAVSRHAVRATEVSIAAAAQRRRCSSLSAQCAPNVSRQSIVFTFCKRCAERFFFLWSFLSTEFFGFSWAILGPDYFLDSSQSPLQGEEEEEEEEILVDSRFLEVAAVTIFVLFL